MKCRMMILPALLWMTCQCAGAQSPMFVWSSPRSMALGGVTSTGFDEPANMHMNPASLIKIERLTISSGLSSSLIDAEIDPVGRPAISSRFTPAMAPHVTGAINFGSRLVSAGISLNTFDSYRIRLPSDEATRFQGTDLMLYAGGLDIALGFMPIQDLSFGFKIGLLGSYAKWERRTNPFPSDPDSDFDINWKLKMHSLSDLSVLTGVMWTPGYRFTTGLTYRPPMKYRFDSDITVGLPDIMGGANISSKTRAVSVTIPQEIKWGFHWLASERIDLYMDLGWTQYSSVDSVNIQADDPKPPYIPSVTSVPMNLKDVWHGHIGAEFMLSGFFTLRTGAFYQTESGDPDYNVSLVSRDACWGATAGFGFHFFEWDIDAAFGRIQYDSDRINGSKLPFPLSADTSVSQYVASVSLRYHF
jgi:long-subunit fatty acid transport protein